jgi:hypothetical protein
MEREEAVEPGGRRRRPGRALRRGARFLVGPLVIAGAVFGLVYASAGSGPTSIDGSQPIDYREECDNEGCAREEVKELWTKFREECVGEEHCWMEEVAENAGGTVAWSQDTPEYGHWYYTRPGAVRDMMRYFVYDLDHREAQDIPVRAGQTDTVWHQLLRMGLEQGAGIELTCRDETGNDYDCEVRPTVP